MGELACRRCRQEVHESSSIADLFICHCGAFQKLCRCGTPYDGDDGCCGKRCQMADGEARSSEDCGVCAIARLCEKRVWPAGGVE